MIEQLEVELWKKKYEDSKNENYQKGYLQALSDVHEKLMETYLAEFEWLDINMVLEELGYGS